ncbi:MAG TPA: ABC transporter permease [Ignavibacteria bacterium]|jgi:simple sugar transport system permease protein
MDSLISIAFFMQTLRITIPYLLPSLGATFSEKGGVINIALEGMLLFGAFFTTVGTYYTNNIGIGILCGITGGIFLALVHSITVITFKANQIVSGIALNLMAFGTSKFLCKLIFNSSSNSARISGLESFNIPFINNPFILLSLLAIIISQFVVNKTRFGLRLRAVGENPEAADTLGINVTKIRYYGVLISGALAGLGGAWLAFDQHSFTDGMSAGRGYIALAAMIIGKWRPLPAALACLIFGFAESFTLQFQSSGIPTQFIQMLPYVVTIVVLAGFIGKSTPPAADGIPFEKKD